MEDKNTAEWDLILRPHSGWFDLHLRDIWSYRDLVLLFVRRDFVALYKQTVLGPLWFILQPLFTTIVFTIVFGRIARLETDSLPKFLFYMSGNILWQYFAACLTHTSSTFVGNRGVFGKVYFPRLVVPISVVISQMLKFSLQFLFFLLFWAVYSVRGAPICITWVAFLLPLQLVIMAAMGLGAGIIVSSFTTKYRDFTFLLQFGVQLLMYGTTVIYPLSNVDGALRYVVLLNPMTPVIETFRAGFLGAGSFSVASLAYSAIAALLLLTVGCVLFTRVERTFMDTV